MAKGYKVWHGGSVVGVKGAICLALQPEWAGYDNSEGRLEEIERNLNTLADVRSAIGTIVDILCEKQIITREDLAKLLPPEIEIRDIAPGDSE